MARDFELKEAYTRTSRLHTRGIPIEQMNQTKRDKKSKQAHQLTKDKTPDGIFVGCECAHHGPADAIVTEHANVEHTRQQNM